MRLLARLVTMRTCLLAICLLIGAQSILPVSCLAQIDLSGIVIDAETQRPVPYVNIGIPVKAKGTVSSTNGSYYLTGVAKDDRVVFSSIGYEPSTYLVSEVPEEVKLLPRAYKAPLVTIINKTFGKEKIKGIRAKSGAVQFGWGELEQLGIEIGNKINIKRESLVKSAHICFGTMTTDSILLRLNIYSIKGDKVGLPLLTENVTFRISLDKDQEQSIDLSHLNLIVDGDVLVSIEAIESFSEADGQYIGFKGKPAFVKKERLYTRRASQDEFVKDTEFLRAGILKFNLGFYLRVKEVQ